MLKEENNIEKSALEINSVNLKENSLDQEMRFSDNFYNTLNQLLKTEKNITINSFKNYKTG